LDIEKIRRDTPSCERIIHFNNAGCSLIPESVYARITAYLTQEQDFGGYETELARIQELEEFYTSAASLIGCEPDEIAFCDGNTRGWQQFFYSLKLRPGDRIITTRVDYGSNIVAYIQAAKNEGAEIDFIETDNNGDLDLTQFKTLISDRTRLVSISHIPTGCGLVNDAESIGEIAASESIPYLLDACQSTGHLDLDVKKIRCTALSTTGRKYLRGPRGTGFLYVSRNYFETAEPAWLEQQGVQLIDANNYELVDSARRFENFECHMAGKLGLKLAMEYANKIGLENIENRITQLSTHCRRQLGNIPDVTIHDHGVNQCGIVTFTVDGQDPSETKRLLWENKINTWVSVGPGSLIDFQSRGLDSVTRASLHYYNTEEEIDKFCEVVARLTSSGDTIRN